MSNKPLVSIVMPSHNQSQYLESALKSLFDQDYSNIEYLVADGGSTDGSLEILQRFADKFAWWVSEKDAGQSDAVNKALRQAKGEIIGWLNSDDLLHPGAVTAAMRAFAEHPEASIVFGDVDSIDASGQRINCMRFGPRRLRDLMGFQIISQPGVFIRRSIIDQAGLLDPDYHFLMDHQWWLRLVQLAPAVYIPGPVMASARFHADAKNVAQSHKFVEEAQRILRWMEASPDYQPLFIRHRRSILAGYYEFITHYKLDGGDARGAFVDYLRLLLLSPRRLFKHFGRFLYSFFAMFFNVSAVRGSYLNKRKKKFQ